MKKVLAVILVSILMLTFFASCSAMDTSTASDENYAGGGDSAPQEGESEDSSADGSKGETVVDITTNQSASLSEKIIYTANANIETVDFDHTIELVYEMLDTYNAFLESSNVGGTNYSSAYYGHQTYRTAEFTIRVPKDNYTAMTTGLSTLGNVTSSRSDAQNITAQYTDTQSRLITYETEEDRLLVMLERADTVEDMIAIEERLSEVRYQIESLTATLKNWQNQVDYSTVSLYIQEVAELTDLIPVQRSYLQEIGDGLNSTLKGIANFFKWLLKAIIVALPVLIILVVIGLITLIIIRARLRKRKATPPTIDKNKEDK